MKKLFLQILFIMLFSNLFSQSKNYTVSSSDIKSEKTKSEFTTLSIVKVQNPVVVKSFVAGTVAPFLLGQIPKIPEYISKIVANSKKKYVAEYSAKNSLTFLSSKDYLPSLTFKRYINIISEQEEQLATEIILKPKLLQDKYLTFHVDEATLHYSKAKIKKNYSVVNLLVDICVTYGEIQDDGTIKKTELKSTSLKIPVKVGASHSINDELKNNLTDVFALDNILSISVKVTETNPYKIQLENLETFAADYKEPISDFFTKLGESLKK